MSTDIITVTEFDAPIISIAPDAQKLKQEALERAADIIEVADALDRDMANDAMIAINALLKPVEKAREAVKKPVLDLGRAIDKVAKDYVADLKTEYDRLSRLTGAFDAAARERQRIAEAEAQRKAEEARRAEIQALRERERLAEAEAARLRAEAEAAAKENPEHADELLDLAEAKSDEAARRISDETAALAKSISADAKALAPAREVPSGAAVRGVWEYEITDAAALYRVHPECFTLEPVKSAITAALEASGGKLPGIVRAIKVFKTSLRG
jgi:cell division septum initiation protein DivIVA